MRTESEKKNIKRAEETRDLKYKCKSQTFLNVMMKQDAAATRSLRKGEPAC